MVNKFKKIGLLTSGGDSPGMNACIRSVVRTAISNDIEVIGIKNGYKGLLTGDVQTMETMSVSEILHTGGTILGSARCKEMQSKEGKEKAIKSCEKLELDALIVIGGDGSLTGALELSKLGLPVIGIPGTIDLDLNCSDYTIGFDTAVNTSVDAISKLRDTSFSHQRCSVVEVMGRNCGAIALWSAISCGAEEVIVPELEYNEETLINLILKNKEKGKLKNIIVVAEGIGNSQNLAKSIEEKTGIETRATILGHLQRGGSPTAIDRMHSAVMGFKAIETLLEGRKNRVIIFKNGEHTDIDLADGLNCPNNYDNYLYKIIKTLSI